ncbi:uncharacterized protein LOC123509130 [Portunus trituberculatus]|uniref:uncharacterized protein LOC123509130 n=1 Tax=Portunus trituberculatus TaxID=210409 RepID=UPI001E1CBD47|nr:uncharacterized protein LOC123509130 [Portunus trituberculatus]
MKRVVNIRKGLIGKVFLIASLPLVVFLFKTGDVDSERRGNLDLTPPRHRDAFDLRKTALRAKGPLAADDPLTVAFLRSHYLDTPTNLTYNLREATNLIYTRYKTMYPSWSFINHILQDFYDKSPAGFFVEAGALDGEFLSNTLMLERRLGWTGLLVEAEEESYRSLRSKNRRAWSSRGCLGAKNYPYASVLSSYRNQGKEASWAGRGAARLEENPTAGGEGPGYKTFQTVQCFPPLSLLLAVNASYIHFFSLDVEGAEMNILKIFPFDRVTVDVWAIEHVRPNATPSVSPLSGTSSATWYEDPALISFMESKGYYLFDVFCHPIPDYIFVRRGSEVFRRLDLPPKLWRREGVCARKGMWDKNAPYSPLLHRDPRHWPQIEYREGDDSGGGGGGV